MVTHRNCWCHWLIVYRGVTCCGGYKRALHCQKHHHSAFKVTEQNIQQKTWVRDFMLYSRKILKKWIRKMWKGALLISVNYIPSFCLKRNKIGKINKQTWGANLLAFALSYFSLPKCLFHHYIFNIAYKNICKFCQFIFIFIANAVEIFAEIHFHLFNSCVKDCYPGTCGSSIWALPTINPHIQSIRRISLHTMVSIIQCNHLICYPSHYADRFQKTCCEITASYSCN